TWLMCVDTPCWLAAAVDALLPMLCGDGVSAFSPTCSAKDVPNSHRAPYSGSALQPQPDSAGPLPHDAHTFRPKMTNLMAALYASPRLPVRTPRGLLPDEPRYVLPGRAPGRGRPEHTRRLA